LIDLHCHILPGIDDGPESLDDALEMCRIAAGDGIRTVVATPHCYKGRYANDASTILPVYDLLQRRIREEGIDLTLLVAGDMHIDPDLASFLQDNPSLCPGGRFVLIELPSEVIPRFIGEFLFALRVKGFTPILTHPERNRMIQHRPALVEEWLPGGVLTQLTAMSLTGEFGAEAQSASFALLDRGCVDFVATDAHSPGWRKPVLSTVTALLRERIGEEGARRLVEENPRRILAGQDPLKIEQIRRHDFIQNFA
jgi:protein-tyrosine phosphatase